MVALVTAQTDEQILDRLRRALDPLQEVRPVEDQQPGDAVDRIQVTRDAGNLEDLSLVKIKRRKAGVGYALKLHRTDLPDR